MGSDTIFALATPRGKSGVAVIRVSGAQALQVGEALAGPLPSPGRFALRPVRRSDGEVLDRALVLVFEGPRSFTGEDTVEFQVHGSIAVIKAIETAIEELGLAQRAQPGEFTRWAMLNGAMDLAQVEALGDLIAAETEAQRVQAQENLSGAMRALSDRCRERLLRALALIEATIDFADEEVPQDVTPEVEDLLAAVASNLRKELAGSRVAERLREGFEVAILGPPNVGKSTLLNRIAGRDIAITSEIAGTTRDVLEVRVDLFGLPVTFLDTAGLREAEDEIERIGVARARERAEQADLRLLLRCDDSMSSESDDIGADIVVGAKADITGTGVSGLTGKGVDDLLQTVHGALAGRLALRGVASRERHRAAISNALDQLDLAVDRIRDQASDAEMIAEDVRQAIVALDSLVGRIDVEAVLGEVFSEFCIGK